MKYVESKLYSTKDYELFVPCEYNRDVKKTKLLEKSMRKYGFDDGLPIRCRPMADGRLAVTHGHHRLHVAQSLQLPVWFIVASRDIPMFESEASSHQWNVSDYAVARERAGERDASEALQFHRETGISLQQSISLVGGECAGSSNKAVQLKMGTYKAKDNKHAREVKEVVVFLKNIGCSFATKSYFVNAISKCLMLDEFDIGTFLHKCRTHQNIMEDRRNVDDFLDLIELVYNRQTPKKNMVPVAFLAKQKALTRRVSFGK